MTLTEFLLARIAEDEARAKSMPREWPQAVADHIWGGRLAHNEALHDAGWDDAWDFGRTVWQAMRATCDPARVLARCEADRQIVALGPTPCPMREPAYDGDDDLGEHHHYPDAGWQAYPHYEVCADCKESAAADYVWRSALLALALPYADHPDYREEWKP